MIGLNVHQRVWYHSLCRVSTCGAATNTKFKPLLLLIQTGMTYTNTYKHRISNFNSILIFLGQISSGSAFPQPDKKKE